MSDLVSFAFGLAFMWAMWKFAAVPRWQQHFRGIRGYPVLWDLWRKVK